MKSLFHYDLLKYSIAQYKKEFFVDKEKSLKKRMKAPDWLIQKALAEDLGQNGDLTTRFFIPPHANIQGFIVLKADGIICGTEIAKQVFQKVDSIPQVKIIDLRGIAFSGKEYGRRSSVPGYPSD